MWKRKYLYTLLLAALLSLGGWQALNGQEHDFCTWMKLGVEYEMRPKWTLSGDLEWRTKDHAGAHDRLGLSADLEYGAASFLKIGGGYEVHYRNRGEDGWKFRHRYHADGTLSAKWMRMKVDLRERFQHTWNKEEKEFRLRSRLKIAYDIRRCKMEPYASVEMYNGLGKHDNFDIMRMRYRVGMKTPLFSERWEADIFYCRQWEADGRKNIFGIDCAYKF